MNEEKKTGEAVREPTTEKKPVPATPAGEKKIQVHSGNIETLKIQFLAEITVNLGRIARCMEISLKEQNFCIF